jgi:hypothetical protein
MFGAEAEQLIAGATNMLAYFGTMGVMLAVYCLFRWLAWLELGSPMADEPTVHKTDETPGKAIDAMPLCDRLQQVRHDYLTERPAAPPSFKQSLRVESKRAEVAKQAFFQKPPEALPEEREERLTLMLV